MSLLHYIEDHPMPNSLLKVFFLFSSFFYSGGFWGGGLGLLGCWGSWDGLCCCGPLFVPKKFAKSALFCWPCWGWFNGCFGACTGSRPVFAGDWLFFGCFYSNLNNITEAVLLNSSPLHTTIFAGIQIPSQLKLSTRSLVASLNHISIHPIHRISFWRFWEITVSGMVRKSGSLSLQFLK